MVSRMLDIRSIGDDARIAQLKVRIARKQGVVHAGGLWGSSAPMIGALALGETTRPQLYITAHLTEADNARDDLELFFGREVGLFPAWESIPGEGGGAMEIAAERLRICALFVQRLREGKPGQLVIVAPIQALMQPVPTQAVLADNTLTLSTEDRRNDPAAAGPDPLLNWAVDHGFERLDLVESPGDVARRGDIVDVFAPGEQSPFRITFFGDEIESLRRFDVGTQRSIEPMVSISITGSETAMVSGSDEATDLFAYLPADALVTLDGPAEIQEMGALLIKRIGDAGRLLDINDVLARAGQFPQMYLSRFATSSDDSDEDAFDLGVKSLSRFETTPADAMTELCQLSARREIHVFCENNGEEKRLREMIARQDGADSISIHPGALHRGFEWTEPPVVVVPHHELFHRERKVRRLRKVHASRPLETWTDLTPGDHVVHAIHGIAIYRGLSHMQKGDSDHQEEFLNLEFADGALVHVPSSQIDMVRKYIGAGGRKPQLSTLGGKRWARTKQRVAESVEELAESLLRVQAIRAEASGTAYPADTEWQREFEAAFVYEETEDQLVVADEIKDDLSQPRPMDRLICGDVGYGKTELAMRAAFKVVEYGRQVAVLVPTTVLAEQHHQTFRDRMAEYPFNIGCLSRFQTAAEQKKVLDQIRRGQVDMVIGTHRLLSKDIRFANLGLVIIDEEQRFGVEHKERLKSMRETVDVLTLTATPIPRTLHMAVVGIRDISSLQTPPVDRRSIQTHVGPFSRQLIRDAILRELNRDGQVYFVHNRVHSIAAMADTVKSIVPEARVVFGHGQMKGAALESVMRKFSRRQADVLVATTIIESGIDNPSANTIFIDRADRFGLADLHQLRGRVGRSDHRAYCYLLLPGDRPPTPKAAKRLKTIEEFSELGAGFRIAMRDLEIRGAGNLLGSEQSGHIGAVGYDMYCQLLEKTVRRLRNEPDPSPTPVQIDLDVAAHVPRHYIAADRSRLEIYRRIVNSVALADLEQVERDLVDAFGAFPEPVGLLLALAEVRIFARMFGVRSISVRRGDVIFGVTSLRQAENLFQDAPGTVRTPDERTVHLRLPASYLEPKTLLPVIRNMLSRAAKHSEQAI